MSTNRKNFPRRQTTRSPIGNIHYWGKHLDDIILAYNESTEADERNQLYRTHLDTPLKTLVECLTAKFTVQEMTLKELRDEVLHHLVLQLGKYDRESGKSFSYFTVIAKHYIWQYNQKTLKHHTHYVSVEGIQYMMAIQVEDHYGEIKDDTPNTFYKVQYPEKLKVYQPDLTLTDRKERDPFVTYLYTVDTCGGNRRRDKEIVVALRYVFTHAHKYKTIHKKAILKKIRDMTNYKTEHIRRTIERIKENYQKTLY